MWRPSMARPEFSVLIACMVLVFPASQTQATEVDTNRKLAEEALRLSDYQRAARLLQTLAQSGDSHSQYRLAALIRAGHVRGQSPAKAFHWMKKAAETSNTLAVVELALMYRDGYGTKRDVNAARQLLTRAAKAGNLNAVRALSDLNSSRQALTNKSGRTDWTTTVTESRQSNLRNSHTDQPAKEKSALLIQAIQRGLTDVVVRLLDGGADPNTHDGEGNPMLLVASASGNQTVVEKLIAAGARVNEKTKTGASALLLAAQEGHHEIVAQLLRAGADPAANGASGESAVDAALSGCHTASVRELIRVIDLRKMPTAIKHPLHTAAKNCRADLSALLLESGVPINKKDDNNRTALWQAAEAGNAAVTDLLLSKGANPAIADKSGDTALHRAANGAQAAIALRLVKAGAPTDIANTKGNTPLMLAASSGLKEVVRELISKHVDLNRRNRIGMSALMLAALKGQSRVVEQLLEAGADPGLRNIRRERAIDLARAGGFENIASAIGGELK